MDAQHNNVQVLPLRIDQCSCACALLCCLLIHGVIWLSICCWFHSPTDDQSWTCLREGAAWNPWACCIGDAVLPWGRRRSSTIASPYRCDRCDAHAWMLQSRRPFTGRTNVTFGGALLSTCASKNGLVCSNLGGSCSSARCTNLQMFARPGCTLKDLVSSIQRGLHRRLQAGLTTRPHATRKKARCRCQIQQVSRCLRFDTPRSQPGFKASQGQCQASAGSFHTWPTDEGASCLLRPLQ